MNDINVNQTFREMYTTKTIGFAPVTPVGLVISVYKDDNITQTTAGVTISEDHDGITGSHLVTIVTTDGFYVSGSDYFVKVTAGTSDGVSVIGDIVGRFSIENRNIDADITKINGSIEAASNMQQVLKEIVTDYCQGTHTINTFELAQANPVANSLISSTVIFDSASSLGAGVSRNVIAYDGSTVTVDEDFPSIPIDNDIVTFYPSGNTGTSNIDNIENIVNAILLDTDKLENAFIKAAGEIGAGSANTIKLSGASSVDDFYRWDIVTTIGPVSGGQSRLIIAYDGTTKLATVFPDWEVNPPTPNGNADDYIVIPGQLRSMYSLDGVSQTEIAALIQVSTNAIIAQGGVGPWTQGVTGTVDANVIQVNGLTTADGVSFNDSFQLMNAMVNGRFKIDEPDPGKITFYKRDNLSILTIVETSKTERIRNV